MTSVPHLRAAAPPRWALAGALFALYAIWGSTYLAMRFALEGFPPFRMASIRFLSAGLLMLAVARARGEPLPPPRQWRNALAIGTLLLAMGNGGVSFAEQTVGSGLAAMMISTMPLWMALFSGLWGQWPTRTDWLALAVGAVGVGVLSAGGDLRASPIGTAALLVSAASWAFGSLWSRRLELPSGAMAAAAEMLCGGVVLCALSGLRHETMHSPPGARAVLALVYLALFGSLVAYSAYLWLLAHVRPAVAGSYAYVNPAVAVLLGVALGGERLHPLAFLAMPLILASVVRILLRPSTVVAIQG